MLARRDYVKPHKANHATNQPAPRPTRQPTSQPTVISQPTSQFHLFAQATGDIVANHALGVAAEFKQHVTGEGLIASVMSALMEGVDLPRGYSILYADTFGYDGCLALAVLKANAQDPGVDRSCITICTDMDVLSYVTNKVGTCVFSMAKSKDISVEDFPDLQQLVDTCKQPTADPRASLTLLETLYMPGPRVLAVLERNVSRWASDPVMGEEPRA